MKNNKEKRKARKKQTAEDFTPLTLVNEILDRLTIDSNNEVWAEDKIFVDPVIFKYFKKDFWKEFI